MGDKNKNEQVPIAEIHVFSVKDVTGFALRALHFVGDSIRHETPSEHFVQEVPDEHA